MNLDPGVEYRLICFRGQSANSDWRLPSNARFVELPVSSRVAVNALWIPFGRPRIESWTGPLDLLHVPSTDFPVPTHLPLVVTLHDLFPERYPSHFKRLGRWRRSLALGQMQKQAGAVIAISESTRRDAVQMLRLPESRIFRIYHGGPDLHEPPEGERIAATLQRHAVRTPFFLFIGIQNRRKNLPGLLRAFADYRRKAGSSHMLVLAGSPAWRHFEVRREVERLALNDAVRITGHVTDEDLSCLYSSAEALVYPSLWEGFGFPPLEAMAAGLPVVASTGGAIPEIVGDAALLHEPTDEASLTDAMIRITSEPGLRAQLRLRGYDQARRFSWDRAARETLALYQQVHASL
jgi:glycosyltransferase involved in cell wall biosynthesis